MLKRVALVAVAIALLVPALIGVWRWGQAPHPVAAQTSEVKTDYNPAQTITVVGQGSVQVQPDIARISIGVETIGETAAEAVQENETQMQSILAALKKAGIADKDIQTMNYSLYVERQSEPMPTSSGKEVGIKVQYHVSNMVNVTVRDLEAVGDVLDDVIEAGANNIWGVSFSLEDPKPAQADARAKAIADAQARAQALAVLSGVELGPVMSVSEVVGGGITPVVAMAVERAAGGGGAISPGELEITYQVQVSYFISPLAAGLPNPASKFCEDQGYKLEIRTAADGSQTGYCIFPDGSECEEWAFFRGECKPGTPKP